MNRILIEPPPCEFHLRVVIDRDLLAIERAHGEILVSSLAGLDVPELHEHARLLVPRRLN